MIDKSLIRDLVKSVIAEEVAAMRQPKAAAAPAAEERVAIASDADLVAFARRVLSLAGDPAKVNRTTTENRPIVPRLAHLVTP